MGGWYSHTPITIQEYSVLKVSTGRHVKKPNLKEKKVKWNETVYICTKEFAFMYITVMYSF